MNVLPASPTPNNISVNEHQFQVYYPENREQLRITNPTWWWMYSWAAGILLSRELSTITTPTKILEVGCGLGLASTVASKLGHDITCTDLVVETEWYVMQTALTANVIAPKWKRATDITDTFELIVFSDVLYAQFRDPMPFVESLVSRLTSQGTILCIEPHRPEVLSPVLDALATVGLEVINYSYLDLPPEIDAPWEESTYVKLQIHRK